MATAPRARSPSTAPARPREVGVERDGLGARSPAARRRAAGARRRASGRGRRRRPGRGRAPRRRCAASTADAQRRAVVVGDCAARASRPRRRRRRAWRPARRRRAGRRPAGPSRSTTWAAESRSACCSGERRTSISRRPAAASCGVHSSRSVRRSTLPDGQPRDGVDHDDVAQVLVGGERVGDELLELAVGRPAGPGSSCTAATGTSPARSSAMPNTAQSSTAGWPCSTASTSAGATWKPLTLIISLERSVRWTQPSGSSQPTSPVRYQPSANASAFASSGR